MERVSFPYVICIKTACIRNFSQSEAFRLEALYCMTHFENRSELSRQKGKLAQMPA